MNLPEQINSAHIDASWLARWVEAINGDQACQYNGRKFNGAIAIVIENSRHVIKVNAGKITELISDTTILEPSAFTLNAAQDVWAELFAPDPKPMRQAFFAAIGVGDMQVEGDLRPLFQQMTTLSEWLRVGRELNGKPTIAPDPVWPDEFQAVGRYQTVEVDGVKHKVFYFEAGEGIPVLCQHTAGNENRQWRHLLEDRELTQKYRFIAYDLPAHGKSDPPYSDDFHKKDLLLTSDWITKFVANFSDSLGLENPIFIGCSIGGVIACHLAEKYPEKFRGLIGMAGTVPTYGFFHDWWIDPAVNAPLMLPGVVDAVMPPGISAHDRQINRMCQSAHPQAMRSDLYFWGVENTDQDRAGRIDADKVPLYLFAGEYDFTCPPEWIEQTAASMSGTAHYQMLEGLGHFPMSEDYTLFRPTLVKTLDEIAANAE
ncbi:MAG: alpha/beta hydrolase [Pseudomonadota bacterium]